jgi:hypothetical protein
LTFYVYSELVIGSADAGKPKSASKAREEPENNAEQDPITDPESQTPQGENDSEEQNDTTVCVSADDETEDSQDTKTPSADEDTTEPAGDQLAEVGEIAEDTKENMHASREDCSLTT